MNNCLITITDPDTGYAQEIRGLHDFMRAPVFNENTSLDELDMLPMEERFRKVKTWSCREEDVDLVVERMSQQWVGHEIKVFKLFGAFQRLPGELRKKQISKEGVLPE